MLTRVNGYRIMNKLTGWRKQCEAISPFRPTWKVAFERINEKVLDMSNGVFSDTIVNSTETDKEILKATIDLLSLLITGNQMVIC